jgi:predicted naringenin-chalcone synthase
MLIYEKEAPDLARRAAWQALNDCAARSRRNVDAVRNEITHLLVVTCTGFFAPGLDFVLARDLGLNASVRRTVIGFMGCAAAFNGLRHASEVVAGQTQARVLVVCVELCSVHIQPGTARSDLVAAALFGDAAAACVVGSPGCGTTPVPEQTADREASNERQDVTRHETVFEFEAFHTAMQPETEREMVWHVGDRGFALNLSPLVPKHLERAAPGALERLFGGDWPRFWAIHPGGRAIVDRLARLFELTDDAVSCSRAVLRDVGNVSSATILFVLDALRRGWESEGSEGEGSDRTGIAMAFGPGLVVEAARLTYHAPPAPRAASKVAAQGSANRLASRAPATRGHGSLAGAVAKDGS